MLLVQQIDNKCFSFQVIVCHHDHHSMLIFSKFIYRLEVIDRAALRPW